MDLKDWGKLDKENEKKWALAMIAQAQRMINGMNFDMKKTDINAILTRLNKEFETAVVELSLQQNRKIMESEKSLKETKCIIAMKKRQYERMKNECAQSHHTEDLLVLLENRIMDLERAAAEHQLVLDDIIKNVGIEITSNEKLIRIKDQIIRVKRMVDDNNKNIERFEEKKREYKKFMDELCGLGWSSNEGSAANTGS